MKTLIFLLTIIAATSLVRAGEIVPVWQTEWDIDATSSYQKSLGQNFLKGHDQFMIILVDSDVGSVQVRETATGKLLRSELVNNIYEENKFLVLPDSARFIMSVGGVRSIPAGFEVRSVDDFSIINKFELPLEGDAFDEKNRPYNNRIIDIKIDPVKPYVYFILEKGINGKQFGENTDFYTIKAYNYETSEEIKELRSYEKDYMKIIDVSKDGKHLASLNDGESYLNIWDLENFELVSTQKMFEKIPEVEWWVESEDIKFDSFDNTVIYFSGLFQDSDDPKIRKAGVFEYVLNSGSFKNLAPDYKYDGKLIFIENQRILFLGSNSTLLFFNFLNLELELLTLQPNNYKFVSNAIYTPKYKYFISSDNGSIYSTQYLTKTSIDEIEEVEKVLFPNPTTDIINIEVDCNESELHLTLLNTQGSIINQITKPIMNNTITFNLIDYPSGIYLLQFLCNNKLITYKIVKEG